MLSRTRDKKHRITDRFKTSRSIRSVAFSARNRFSSATSPVESPCVPSRSARSLATQLPRVPGWTPRSRAIWAIGLALSRTMRTEPSRNSGSNFLRDIWHDYSSYCMPPRFWGMSNIEEKALARTSPPNIKTGRYHPPDALLGFLESL